MLEESRGNGYPPEAPNDLASERQTWRERMLRGLGWANFAAIGVASVLTLVQGLLPRVSEVLLFGTLALSLLGLLLPKLEFPERAGALFASLYLACIIGLSYLGFAPNALVGLCMAVWMATLLFGRAGGFTAAIGSTAILVAVPLLERAGLVTRVGDWATMLDASRGVVVLRVAAIFFMGAMACVVGISYLVGQAEQLLIDKTRTLERLLEEEREKERLRERMSLREAAFRKAQELEILGRLSSSMAHDFNNALLVIFASVDELEEYGEFSEQSRLALDAIRAAATQGAATTRELRAFGPHASTGTRPERLLPLVERMATILSRVLPRNIELTLERLADPTVLVNEGQLQRAITNLALNARDAMRDGGKLTLSVREASEAERGNGRPLAVLEVADTGVGMSQEVKARLFEPFFTTKAAAGTGLGLATVREFVTELGGRVEVRSELGRGTAISLFLPGAEETSGAAPKSEPRPERQELTVLIVDDDQGVRRALQRGLERHAFKVLEASDASEGLLVARRHREPIHALCSDSVMPGAPARQLIEGFRSTFPDGKVILWSGYAEPDSSAARIADVFLHKPFSSDELARQIRRVVGRR